MQFAIIIVSYNAMPWITRSLASTGNFSVVVVDNASTDQTVHTIKKNFPTVTLLPQEKNLGFGKANNIGISYALNNGADYVFLLNQDAYLEPRCIEGLVAIQKKFPEYGILSPLHLNGPGFRLDKNFSHYLNYNANPDFYSDYVLNKSRKEIYDVPFVNAAGWLLSKACIEKVGGFDPIFFHYGEDDNYCQRVKYHGFKIGICPETKLRHDRETRIKKVIKTGSAEYWDINEISLKVRYGDINQPYGNELAKLAKKRKIAFRKSLLKFNFSAARFLKRESERFQKVHQGVLQSREINQRIGMHYLNLKSKNVVL